MTPTRANIRLDDRPSRDRRQAYARRASRRHHSIAGAIRLPGIASRRRHGRPAMPRFGPLPSGSERGPRQSASRSPAGLPQRGHRPGQPDQQLQHRVPRVIERAARAEVAGWIAISCPKFTYLTKGG